MDRLVSVISIVAWIGGCQPTPAPEMQEPLAAPPTYKHKRIAPAYPIPLIPPPQTAPSPRLRDELDKVQSQLDALRHQLKGD